MDSGEQRSSDIDKQGNRVYSLYDTEGNKIGEVYINAGITITNEEYVINDLLDLSNSLDSERVQVISGYRTVEQNTAC